MPARPPSTSRTSRATGRGAASTSPPRASGCGTATGWRLRARSSRAAGPTPPSTPTTAVAASAPGSPTGSRTCARSQGLDARRPDRPRRQRAPRRSSRPAATGVGWTSWVLQLPADLTIEPQPLPDGYTLREFAGAADGRVAFQLIEDAFNEWPDRDPSSYDDWAPRGPLRPGFEPWQIRFAVDPAGHRGRGLLHDPRGGHGLRRRDRGPARPARPGPGPGPPRRRLRARPGARRHRQRALHRLADRSPRSLRARRHAGHPDLAAVDDRPLSLPRPRDSAAPGLPGGSVGAEEATHEQ